METEYGLRARRDGRIIGADEAGQLLFVPLARARGSTSAFLRGGGRLYLDVGSKPEYATPECTSATDAVVADRATMLRPPVRQASRREPVRSRHALRVTEQHRQG